jgi:CheY-like chemotaxis protein
MPGELRSPELARRAKLAQPALEVLFTSGYTENGIVHDGRLERGVALLSKPYSREDLARKIRHQFANRDHLQSMSAASRVGIASTPAPSPLSILLVEDNADMREMTTEVLKVLGYEAETAASGEEALSMLARHVPQVLITDIGLPGISGYELAERARALGVRAVLFASGYGASRDLPSGSFWLTKPFSVETIQSSLTQIAGWSESATAEL